MARLDRLVTAKAVAQYAAVIGRQFSYVLLHTVSPLNEKPLQAELHRLVEAELLYQRGLPPQATYTFKHALVQDAAYQSLLKRTRQQIHQQIAEVLAEDFPETMEAQPELLAHHYTGAGLGEPAVAYWQRAGELTVKRSAHAEAIAHLQKGIELLNTLPETSERILQELRLQRTLGVPLLATKGFAAPEVEAVYSRARTLCRQVGDTSQLFPVLFGLWGVYHLRMEWQTIGDTLYYLGEFLSARIHLEQGIALYDINYHRSYAFLYVQDPLVGCQSYAFSLCFALRQSLVLYGYLREWQTVLEQADILETLVKKQGLKQWLAGATMAQGFALAMLGNREGVAQVRQGIRTNRSLGGRIRPGYLIRLAEVSRVTGQLQEGLHLINEALSVAKETGERHREAESHRLKGELLLQLSSDNHAEAESCFQIALDVAPHQEAKSLELRAATSLTRLWQSQGKHQEAYNLLVPLYAWFTEGFDTADLKDAKELLAELS